MHRQLSPIDWIVLFSLAFIWGSSFILMKEGLVSFTAPQVAALRLCAAGLVLLPYSLSQLKKINGRLRLKIFIVGCIGNGIPAFLFTWAESHISSSVAGILNTLTPIFTLTIGVVFFQAKASWKKVLGIFIALTGCVLLIWFRGSNISSSDADYGWVVVVATMCYGLSVNLLRRWLQQVPALIIVSFAFLVLGMISSVYLFSTDFVNRITVEPNAVYSLVYVLILGIVGTSLANVLYYRLVQKITPVNASLVTFLMPIVALGWGWMYGEPVGWQHFSSMAMILAGVYLVSRG